MKKAGYIVLLLILLLQSGGLFLVCKIHQLGVQYKMMLAIKQDQAVFQNLTLTVPEFQTSRINAHEISWKGNRYDFKSAVVSSGKVELLVINDTKEESIIENIQRFFNSGSQQNQGKELPNNFLKLLGLQYTFPETGNIILAPETRRNVFRSLCEMIISYPPSISSPPPEWGSSIVISYC